VVKAAPIATCTWCGFYVGGSVGASHLRSETDYNAPEGWDTDYATDALKTGKTGGIYGAQFGYNWQFRNGVFGIEGDISGLFGLGMNRFGAYPDSAGSVTASTDVTGFASVRARFGYDFTGTMIYGTVGIGWVHVKNNLFVNELSGGVPKGGNFSSSKWTPAFVMGGGVEQALDAHWSLRGEVLVAITDTVSALPTDLHYYDTTTPPVYYNHMLTIGRLALNYRF
jgi:outer membrane immunogenic protein